VTGFVGRFRQLSVSCHGERAPAAYIGLMDNHLPLSFYALVAIGYIAAIAVIWRVVRRKAGKSN